MLALLSREVVQPLHVKQPAVGFFRVIQLDDKESAKRPSETYPDVGFSLYAHHPLVYRAETLRLGSA